MTAGDTWLNYQRQQAGIVKCHRFSWVRRVRDGARRAEIFSTPGLEGAGEEAVMPAGGMAPCLLQVLSLHGALRLPLLPHLSQPGFCKSNISVGFLAPLSSLSPSLAQFLEKFK